MEITCVTVDCANPEAVASFWNGALDWGGVAAAPDGSGALCGPRGGGIYLEFVQVPETKTLKNRVHLGCSAGTLADLDETLERVRGLGGTIAWEEDFRRDIARVYRSVVLQDVEGNEFCLSGGRLPG